MTHLERPDPLALDPDAMRRLGYDAIDGLVARWAGLDGEPAWRGADRATAARLLARPAPETPEDPHALLEMLRADVMPLASRVDHPRFFGYVPGCPTWPGVIGDLLASGYNTFAGTWQASAGPSQIELTVLDWFRAWIGMPDGAGGLLTSGGSAANLNALVCARETRFGAGSGDAVIYATGEAHSSVARAARIAGFAPDRIRTVAMDRAFRMDVTGLDAMITRDRSAGLVPFMVVANGGATSTGAIDPLPALAELCAREEIWLHVDAAYGGFAVLSERGRTALAGIERADSVVLDPHKWLYQPFEVGCLLVRDVERLRAAFQVLPDYLQDTAVAGGEVNFADRGLQLTRSARALKIWLSICTFGLTAFRAAVERSLDLAEHAESLVRAAPTLELLTPATLGIACFRRRATEAQNAALIAALMESGLGLISSTRVAGDYALRVCPMGHRTTMRDVERVVEFLATSPVENG